MKTIHCWSCRYTLSCPPRLTADTGLDALTHAIEAFVSKKNQPYTDSIALAAMKAIHQHIRTVFTYGHLHLHLHHQTRIISSPSTSTSQQHYPAPIAAISISIAIPIPCARIQYRNPEDKTAREHMMLAATQAGMAFSNASVCLVHGMSRPIGAHFNVPHGMSNAMLLPEVTAFSSPAVPWHPSPSHPIPSPLPILAPIPIPIFISIPIAIAIPTPIPIFSPWIDTPSVRKPSVWYHQIVMWTRVSQLS